MMRVAASGSRLQHHHRCAAIKAPKVVKSGARSSSRMVVVPRGAKSFSASSASASTSKSSTACTFLRHRGGGRQHNLYNAIAVPEPEINNDEIVGTTTTTMEYNETGKWREGFDLAGWAKEIREVRTKKRSFFFVSSSSFVSRIGLDAQR